MEAGMVAVQAVVGTAVVGTAEGLVAEGEAA